MDEVFRSDIHYQEHTGVLTHKVTQPTEDVILGRNQELRKNPGAMHDLGAQSGQPFGRQVASIPMILYSKALKDGYDLNSKDAKHAQAEMFRYLKSAEGKMCLIRDKV